MIDNWKICYIAWLAGEIVDKKTPFKSANIQAKTAEEAVEQLRAMMNMCKIDIIGKPVHSYITEAEYNAE